MHEPNDIQIALQCRAQLAFWADFDAVTDVTFENFQFVQKVSAKRAVLFAGLSLRIYGGLRHVSNPRMQSLVIGVTDGMNFELQLILRAAEAV